MQLNLSENLMLQFLPSLKTPIAIKLDGGEIARAPLQLMGYFIFATCITEEALAVERCTNAEQVSIYLCG